MSHRAARWRLRGLAVGAAAWFGCRSADDPRGYLAAVAAALREGRYGALLPTHEQAWLFAAGRHLLPADAPLTVSDIDAFDQVQGKVACCRLLDALGLPQPAWSMVTAIGQARRVELPCWLKASFSTAGRGVRYVTSPGQAARAYDELAAAGPVLAQQPAAGTYAQVAGLSREPTASAPEIPPGMVNMRAFSRRILPGSPAQIVGDQAARRA